MNMERKDWLASWHVTPSINQTYDFLDGIRGLAILMVVASHVIYMNPQASWPLRFMAGIFGAGTNGVTVFFCLSGFLISLPFWKRKITGATVVPKNYGMRRFWKIYPPLTLSILLLTPAYILSYGHAGEYSMSAVKWITGWAWLIPVSGNLNPVMWSLIVEVHFYTILPLLFLGCRSLTYTRTLWLLSAAFFIVPPLARLVYSHFGMHFSLHPTIFVLFPSKLDSFGFGILIAGLLQAGALRPELARLGPIGLLSLLVTLVLKSFTTVSPAAAAIFNEEIIHLMVMISSAMILCFVAKPGAASGWGLESPLLRWLGLLSYEWYLFHQPLFYWTWNLLGSSGGNLTIYLLRVAIPTVSSLLIAALVYRYFSIPILRRARG